MDHLLSRRTVVTATNKDSINIGRCRAFGDMVDFNCGSWLVSFTLAALAYATIVQENDWDITEYPDEHDEYLQHGLFAGPPIFLAIMSFIVPIILNPWVLGWPFLPKQKNKVQRKQLPQTLVGDLPTMIKQRKQAELESTIMETTKEEMEEDDDSFTTHDLRTQSSPHRSVRRIDPNFIDAKEKEYKKQMELARPQVEEYNAMETGRSRSLRSQETVKAVSHGNTRSRESSLERSQQRDESMDRANRSWTAGSGGVEQQLRAKTPPKTSVSWEEARPGRATSRTSSSRGSSPAAIRGRSSRTTSPGRLGIHGRVVSPPQSPRRDQWGFPVSKS